MVVYQDALVTDILAGKDTLTPVLTRAMNVGKQLGALKARGFDIAPDLQKANVQLAKFPMALDAMNIGMKESIARSKELQTRFDMNILSWIFGGMALQRMGMTIMRFVIPSMEKLGQLNDYAAKRILGVYAAWEFLKISIFETLMGIPGVQDFIKGIVDWLIRLAEWAQTHPEAVELLFEVGKAMAVLGTIAIGIGIYDQIAHLTTLLGGAGKEAGFLEKTLSGLGVVAKIFLVYDVVEELLTGESLSKKIFSVALLALALSPVPGGALIAFGIKILVDLLVPDSWWTSLDDWLKDTYAYIKTGISKEQKAMGEAGAFTPVPEDSMFKRLSTVAGGGGNLGAIIGTTAGGAIGTVVGGVMGGIPGALLGAGAGGILGLVIGGGLGVIIERTAMQIDKLRQRTDEADDSLVGHSLVPSLGLLYESILFNVQVLPLMIEQLTLAKVAIDAIPNYTVKIVEIRTVHTGGGSNEDKETVGSVTGGGTLTSKGRVGTVWRSG